MKKSSERSSELRWTVYTHIFTMVKLRNEFGLYFVRITVLKIGDVMPSDDVIIILIETSVYRMLLRS